jgi:hypothetical protein
MSLSRRGFFERAAVASALSGVWGAGGSGKVDLNFFLNGANKNNVFDGIDWKERKTGQPFFATSPSSRPTRATGGRWPASSRSPNWWTRRS